MLHFSIAIAARLAASLALLECDIPTHDGSGDHAPAKTFINRVSIHDVPDGQPLSIRLPNSQAITLTGFKTNTKRGLSDAQCGVSVDGPRLMTMGEGDTDVYTCNALLAAGALPPAGKVQRIGLIYEVSSPTAVFRTAVILLQDGRRWAIDASKTGVFDDAPAGRSIPALRHALRR